MRLGSRVWRGSRKEVKQKDVGQSVRVMREGIKENKRLKV